ncbi:tetratricopeptide repeat protein [Propionibacteriaceae bacterium Y1923]|uniref:tetratricopeptide repeat protein n=1 Tax=Aestuariimicrobium sp. Y1814 TaxID=3418742 RepID=UPI003C162078
MFNADVISEFTPNWSGDPYGRFRWAETLFERKQYREAARELQALLAEVSDDLEVRHGLLDARLLLARAQYHAAHLTRAEETCRAILDDHPTEAYAALLLGRALQRQSRKDEAAAVLARARALGAEV